MKVPARMSGRANVRRTTIVAIPDINGKIRRFLSSMRMFQLVFISTKLLPMLSNIPLN